MTTNTHKVTVYFPPQPPLSNERERLLWRRQDLEACAERVATRYTADIRAIDEQLAALDKQEAREVKSP